ncbi:hypothetical protein [Clostridium hydrogenum]|uniref:hypothetical protein n=1 Tax=Clostridium hydrogenum TaxID=2855764 RepID=UPI001F3D5623|nr:hypothetical protein [Clostridium hydrogenum]
MKLKRKKKLPIIFALCAILFFSAIIINFNTTKTLGDIDGGYMKFYSVHLVFNNYFLH